MKEIKFTFENGIAKIEGLNAETFHRFYNPSIYSDTPSFELMVRGTQYSATPKEIEKILSIFLPKDAERLTQELVSEIYSEHNEFRVESIRIKTDGVSDPEMRSVIIDYINKSFVDMKYDVEVSCVNDVVSITVDMWTHTRGRKHF